MHRKGLIDRYLAEGLPPDREARLRAHLAGCERCRSYYDAQATLLRALAGYPDRLTPAEVERAVRRALVAVGAGSSRTARPARMSALAALPWMPGREVAMAAGLLVVAGLAVFAATRPAAPAGRLVAAEAVEVNGAPASEGAVVRGGHDVVVGAGGMAEIALERGGTARLFPGTSIVLSARGAALDLEVGRVWCDVPKDDAGFRVRTDRGEARVIGTSFVVRHAADGDTEVRVIEGVVEVEDAGGRGTVQVQRGEKTRIERGTAPSPAQAYSGAEDQSDWEWLLRELGQVIERGLRSTKKFLDDTFPGR